MKKLFALSLLVGAVLLSGLSQAQISTPQASPGATLTQRVGLTDVSISYSRPSMKGRKIFGELLPYGQIWRTGANAATKLTFSDEVTLEGKKIPAGEYSLFTIPGADEWTVILNKNPKAGTAEYKQEEDAARFTVKPIKLPTKIETFSISFADVTPTSAFLDLAWENTLLRLKMTTEVDSKVMAQIKEKIASAKPDDAGLYYQAASYYFDNNKDLNQALAWINKSVSIKPEFYTTHLQAKIKSKLKDYKGAVEAAQKSIVLSKEAKNDDYVRLNEKLIADTKAIKQ